MVSCVSCELKVDLALVLLSPRWAYRVLGGGNGGGAGALAVSALRGTGGGGGAVGGETFVTSPPVFIPTPVSDPLSFAESTIDGDAEERTGRAGVFAVSALRGSGDDIVGVGGGRGSASARAGGVAEIDGIDCAGAAGVVDANEAAALATFSSIAAPEFFSSDTKMDVGAPCFVIFSDSWECAGAPGLAFRTTDIGFFFINEWRIASGLEGRGGFFAGLPGTDTVSVVLNGTATLLVERPKMLTHLGGGPGGLFFIAPFPPSALRSSLLSPGEIFASRLPGALRFPCRSFCFLKLLCFPAAERFGASGIVRFDATPPPVTAGSDAVENRSRPSLSPGPSSMLGGVGSGSVFGGLLYECNA